MVGIESKLEVELKRLTPEQRKIIYENVFAIELTEGCSICCDFCGFEAKSGVGTAIPFHVLEWILDEMTQMTDRTTSNLNMGRSSNKPNHLTLYHATDPLDYVWEGMDYFFVHKLFTDRGFKVPVSTAVPKGKEELAVANLDSIHQISISHMNRDRLIPYFERLGVIVYIDLCSYYRAKTEKSGSFKTPIKNLIVPVEGSVEETVRRLREQDPSLPEATRFYDLRRDRNRLLRNVQDLDTLCMFCGNPNEYPREGRITDRDESQVRNNGRAFDLGHYEREYPFDPLRPFCNINGVKLAPEGVYNYVSRISDETNKAGILLEKIDPAKLRVVKRGPANLSHMNHISPFSYVPYV